MNINVLKQFGMHLDDEELTSEFSCRIPACPDGALEIDFSNCIVDYKATSKVIDAAIARLLDAPRPRHLVLIYDFHLPERALLKWFFFGSEKCNLDRETASDPEIRSRIVEGLQKMQIDLTIKIIDFKTQAEVETLQYGK